MLTLGPVSGTPYIATVKPGHVHITSGGLQQIIKSNYSALLAPTVTDDSDSGYAVGSPWVNTVTGIAYTCVDATPGAAQWKDVSSSTNPAGVGTELQYRSSSTSFGAVTGSSVANGGISLTSQAIGAVPLTLNLASGQTADALQINSYGQTGGDKFKIDYFGRCYATDGGGYSAFTVTNGGGVSFGGQSFAAGIKGGSVTFTTGGADWCHFNFGNNTTPVAVFSNFYVGKPVLTLTGANGQTADILQANPYGVTAGTRARVTSNGSFSRNEIAGCFSETFGDGATNSGGYYSTAIGNSANGFGSNATAVGASTVARAGGVVIGCNVVASYPYCILLGCNTTDSSSSGYVFVAGSPTVPMNDVYFGSGRLHTAPTNYTLHGTGGSGTNIVGGNLYLAPGQSTGSGTPASVVIQGTTAGVSGSTAQTLVDVMTVVNSKHVNFYTADVGSNRVVQILNNQAYSGGFGNKKANIATTVAGGYDTLSIADSAAGALLRVARNNTDLGFVMGTNNSGQWVFMGVNKEPFDTGNGETKAIVFGSDNNVGIGGWSEYPDTVSAALHIKKTTEQLRLGYDATNYTSFTTSSGGNLTITPSGGSVGINTSSPNVGDSGSNFTVYGTGTNPGIVTAARDGNTAGWGTGFQAVLDNSAGTPTTYTHVGGSVVSNTAGLEDGKLTLYVRNSGVLTPQAELSSTGVLTLPGGYLKLTKASAGGVDTNVLYTDSNSNTLGFIASSTPAFLASNGPYFGARGNTYSMIAGQRGNLFFGAGSPSAPSSTEGRLIFSTGDVQRLSVDYSGNAVYNDDGNDCDFRIEGDTDANLFVCDAGTDQVLIGTATTATGMKLRVAGSVQLDNKVVTPNSGALTIATGVITVTGAQHTVDTEAAAAADDLDTINGGKAGEKVILRLVNAARIVTIKHGTGNIRRKGGTDYVFTGTDEYVELFCTDGSNWLIN